MYHIEKRNEQTFANSGVRIYDTAQTYEQWVKVHGERPLMYRNTEYSDRNKGASRG